ncbi:1-phosphofructokinase family hexose kinase [Thermoactinospora rubra]|uniref:1-phosphofructokinase family hexose kinase n=1 Tax=Thermoactinospora rubra TaxID=1088767 RepID=UPI000A10B183|nr:1-phosphofructokinase family hexose kinase [Thermoactinospora rubra]
MILTVTLNAALDVTYEVPGVQWGGVNRVRSVHRRAGGKGVNVARVLAALGQEVLVHGFAGGPTGQAIRADLAASGLPEAMAPIAADSRSTLVVAEGSRTTLLNEPGPAVTASEIDEFLRAFDGPARDADVVVLSGSLPPGVPEDFYATLTARASERGARVIVDADGAALRHAAPGSPCVVKPNAEELARAVDLPGDRRLSSLAAGAEALRALGAASVVVSLGEEGLFAATGEGAFRVRLPYRIEGNPTGAGDALVAGLALGLAEGTAWPDTLRRAAALGAAAVAAPVAGDFDRGVYAEVLPKIVIE